MIRSTGRGAEPKVSVCVPTRGHPDEVTRLLRSLLSQTMKDWELVISDDSGDTSVECVVQELMARQSPTRLHYHRNEVPMGPIRNWNAALAPARGRFIKIMFSDDYFTGEKSLAQFVGLLEENPEATLAFSGSRQVLLGAASDLDYQHGVMAGHEIGYTKEGFPYYERCATEQFAEELKKDYRRLFLGNEVGAPSAVILRRFPGDRIPHFDEESGFASDMFLYFDALRGTDEAPAQGVPDASYAGRFAWTEEPLISIGMHAGQYTETFTEQDERIYTDYRRLYKKYDLKQAPFCRKYMTEQFIIPWHKGRVEAEALGIPTRDWRHARMREGLHSIRDYLRNRWKSSVN